MFTRIRIGLGVLAVLVLLGLPRAAGAQAWYQVSFTGADIWNMSPDNASQSRTDQAAPRRYRDWTQQNVVQATTYGLNGGLPGTGFNSWAPTSGFAFDEINLWGAGGSAAAAWGEKYVSVGNTDPGAHGVSSWRLITAPAGWTHGIVDGGHSYSADSTHAFPVWRSPTDSDADRLGMANMNDAKFNFVFQVLISNPNTAFEDAEHKRLRVFFGGYSDDKQMTGPENERDNYEVSGIMELGATEVPEPSSLLLVGGVLTGLALAAWKKRS